MSSPCSVYLATSTDEHCVRRVTQWSPASARSVRIVVNAVVPFSVTRHHDERTPEEIAWWNTNVSDPQRADAKPLPLNAPPLDTLPNPWLLDTEVLLRKLEECRALVMQISISNPAATHEGIKNGRYYDLISKKRFQKSPEGSAPKLAS